MKQNAPPGKGHESFPAEKRVSTAQREKLKAAGHNSFSRNIYIVNKNVWKRRIFMQEPFGIYHDIKVRTNGEIYIGVVGPVRTGKSTFIKKFMELLVLPGMMDAHAKERALDELPQSAAGRTIMTTEPKFIPKEAAKVKFPDDTSVNIRLIDCVGFMTEGATGHIENEKERLVKTPWSKQELPFTKAAEIGTRKVITEHSTVGFVITTDGSFGEIPSENYRAAEKRTVEELRKIGKPFLMLLNTRVPNAPQTRELARKLSDEYGTNVVPINCEELKSEDITILMEHLLSAFPIARVDFRLPAWVEMLQNTHPLKADLIQNAMQIFGRLTFLKDAVPEQLVTESDYIKDVKLSNIRREDGVVTIDFDFDEQFHYEILSELAGIPIHGERELISHLQALSGMKQEYDRVGAACEEVRAKGYGVVNASLDEITVNEPQLIRHGSRYGVKIHATAPSIHMIKANIETEIAPIVGTQEQAEDLISYIKENTKDDMEEIFNTSIFGKSIRQLVEDGIQTKINKLNNESQLKLQETIQKVINDSNGGLVCIII